MIGAQWEMQNPPSTGKHVHLSKANTRGSAVTLLGGRRLKGVCGGEVCYKGNKAP